MVGQISTMKSIYSVGAVFAAVMLLGAAARGDYLDDMGVAAMRATTNLDGSGIHVAQPEASLTPDNLEWEVDPAVVGQPVAKFTYTSSLGTATGFPNSVGSDSGHADYSVGVYFYGPAQGVATNVAYIDCYEANYFINNVVATLSPIAASVVNQSFADTDTNNESAYDPIYDDYAAQYKTLFITGAGDGGPVLPPSTCYNGISVGGYQGYANHTSVGPTPVGGRCKPDITTITSTASTGAGLLSGAAAMLMQAALRGDGGADTNSAFDLRTIKALILNGAVKPMDWTNTPPAPLDLRYGAGVANILNAHEQLAGGKHGVISSNSVSLNTAHPPTGATGTVGVLSGWNLATNTSSATTDAIHHYYFNVSNPVASIKFTATATLVWLRHKNQTGINNLGLFLYNCANSNLVACSTSRVDNVQHLWKTGLASGRYDLQVWKAGGGTVTTNETYALAFEFVPQPVATVTGGASPAVTWPIYPAGFLVEAETNLLGGAWSTNGLPAIPVFTNGQNSIPLNTTNAQQFFRLRKPNL